MIGVEHLISLITTLHKFILQIVITQIEQVQNTIDTNVMITLGLFVELYLLPLLVSRRISPSRTMHE